MGMTNHYTRYARPALWGFFICVAISVVLVVMQLFIPSFIKNRWDIERIEKRTQAEQVIREAFQTRVEKLNKIAEDASRDTLLCAGIGSSSITDKLKSFQSLSLYNYNDDQTIDLVDSQGNVLAWNGPSITSLYKQLHEYNSHESLTYVTQNGLRTYLTVGKKLVADSLYLLVSEPLEVNSPISNRFVQKVSFCAELSQQLKTQVTLKLPHTYIAHKGEYSVPVMNQANNEIAEFFVEEINLESKITSDIDVLNKLIDLCLACGCLFIASYRHFMDCKKTT